MLKLQQKNKYFDDIKCEDIWEFPNISAKVQRRVYDPESMKHPAKMPIFLCQKLIQEYSKEGDWILDPMAGIGTTLVESVLLGRNALGVEFEQKFVDIVSRNLKRIEVFRDRLKNMGKAYVFQGDSRNLCFILQSFKPFDAIVFSPPFGHESYFGTSTQGSALAKDRYNAVPYSETGDPQNVGTLKYNPAKIDTIILSPPFCSEMVTNKGDSTKTYQERVGGYDKYSEKNLVFNSFADYATAMLLIYKQCFEVLKEGGLMVLHTKNGVKNGEMIRLDLDTIKLCEAAGFKLKERKYRKHRNVSFWVKNSRKKYYRKNPSELCADPYADFEDILVFKKEALNNVFEIN